MLAGQRRAEIGQFLRQSEDFGCGWGTGGDAAAVGVLENSIFLQVYVTEAKSAEKKTIGFCDRHAVELFDSDSFFLFLHILHGLLNHGVCSLDVE